MRAFNLLTCCTVLLAGCSFTTAGGLTECETSADCASNQVCNAGFCLPQPEGCGDIFGPTSATNAIPLGAALPLTTSDGPDESEVQALNSIKLAIEEINERQGVGGRPFVLHICDTRSDPERAKEQAAWLVEEKGVPAIFTSGSGQTFSVTSVTIPANVLVMTYSATSPDLATLSDKPQGSNAGLVWRTAPSDALQGRIIGDLLLGRTTVADGTPFASVSSVGIPYVDDAYGQGLFSVVLGRLAGSGRNVSSAKYPRNEDVTAAVNLVANNTPDVAVLVGFSEDNARIVNGAASRGRTGQKWFFTDAGKDPGLFISLGTNRALVEGSYGTAPAQVRPNDPVYQFFVQRFRAAYNNVDPGQFGFTAHAYDGMYLVALGAAYAAGPDVNAPQAITGARIAEGLQRVTPPAGDTTTPTYNLNSTGFTSARDEIRQGRVINVRGASGMLDFDATGEAPSEYELWKVENGVFKTVQLINPPAD